MKRNMIATLVAAVAFAGVAVSAQGADIVDEWASVKAPPAPTLKPVTVDPSTTALLMLDFMNQNCGKRPRCLATIPAMKKLLAAARAAKVLVVYSVIAKTTPADVVKDLAPLANEPHVQSGPNKFLQYRSRENSQGQGYQDGDRRLARRRTARCFPPPSARSLRGFKVITPVDGLSSVEAYADLSTVYTFTTAPALVDGSTLTRSEMIKF